VQSDNIGAIWRASHSIKRIREFRFARAPAVGGRD
jgi:hypothetical protein